MAFADGALDSERWMSVVADAVARINAGGLEKVVLARDLVATADAPVDVRWPLRRLAEDYPMCWTFHVDGLFGATPEMLVRRERGLVTSRVLAGTIRRTGDDSADLALAATLARSSKDLEEHEYAVRSVAEALEPHCSSMNVPEAPFVLHLPNVMHLATDVAGVVHDAATVSSLELAASLHPSAAVGGTPTAVATDLIAEIEGMDRGRYAGPVGWMDAAGDGEWALALRSAEVHGSTVRLFAGCGIVADSDPEAELAEAQAKFLPVRDALTAREPGPRLSRAVPLEPAYRDAPSQAALLVEQPPRRHAWPHRRSSWPASVRPRPASRCLEPDRDQPRVTAGGDLEPAPHLASRHRPDVVDPKHLALGCTATLSRRPGWTAHGCSDQRPEPAAPASRWSRLIEHAPRVTDRRRARAVRRHAAVTACHRKR